MNLFYELFYKKYVESYVLPMPVPHWVIYNEALAFFPSIECLSGFPHSPRKTKKIQLIILHHTGSRDFAKAITWFQNPNNYSSTHYLIDLSGYIQQIVPEEMSALHAPSCKFNNSKLVNDFSIGISLIGDGREAFTEAQYEAVAMLCASLVRRYGLKATDVYRHVDIEHTGEKHNDPSPWNNGKFQELLNHFLTV